MGNIEIVWDEPPPVDEKWIQIVDDNWFRG